MLVVYVLDFAVILVLFETVPTLDGFSVQEVAFLYGTSQLAFAFTDLAIGHLDDFPVMIREGTFDLILVRPLGTLFQVVTADFALRRVSKIAQAVAVLGYALVTVDVDWTVRPRRDGRGDGGERVRRVRLDLDPGAALFWTVEGGEWLNAFTYGGNFLRSTRRTCSARGSGGCSSTSCRLASSPTSRGCTCSDKRIRWGCRALQFAAPVVAAHRGLRGRARGAGAVRRYRSAGG